MPATIQQESKGFARISGLRLGLLLAATVGCSTKPPPVKLPDLPPVPMLISQIEIEDLPLVSMEPGETKTVPIAVVRHEHTQPIGLTIADLPPGIGATVEPLKENQSNAALVLTASSTLGDEDLSAALSITAKLHDNNTAERKLSLRVPKVFRPELATIEPVILQPGTELTVPLPVARNQFQGQIDFALGELPADLSGSVGPLLVETDAGNLTLAASSEAVRGDHVVTVSGTVYGRELKLEVPAIIDEQPFHVEALQGVTLEPGETREIEVPVSRRCYQGPIELEADGLPEGVTMKAVAIPAGATSTRLEFQADATAGVGVRSGVVHARAGHLSEDEPVVIRIGREAEGKFIPEEVVSVGSGVLLRRGSMAGRLSQETKQTLGDLLGSTAEARSAVTQGLAWLARCQQPDGSWTLRGPAATPGATPGLAPVDPAAAVEDAEPDTNPVAATALGLLPFLAEGVSHKSSKKVDPAVAQYRQQVENGLVFLARGQQPDGSLAPGVTLKAHVLGTIALCEAYGLTQDTKLKPYVQKAIKSLATRQIMPGGWASEGSTTPNLTGTGWAILALRTGQWSGVEPPSASVKAAGKFVESCAAGPGAAMGSRYAETPGGVETLQTSAIGLLSRQLLGWKRDDPDLQAGCEYLLANPPPRTGPDLGPIGYYFFATQVLRNVEGEGFDAWNHLMREHLIRTQAQSGPQAGSWDPKGSDQGARGGRVYATSMSLLTLQAYHRHMPLYREIKRKAALKPDDTEKAAEAGAEKAEAAE
jgi:hypothetical protein